MGEHFWDDRLARLYAYWLAKRGARRAPCRRARLDWNGRGWLTLEAVALPLIDDDDGRVKMILRGSSFCMPLQPLAERLEYWPLPGA